ncbi:MAG: type II toxin-antitoxin system RelB/DinJ family antitoxin [Lachnospiraceae bacterium]|nr:type II toxin-antitoxin system RelB/DinJ family antitoxin [Lachnospiraceae bacterium]
MRKKQDVGTNKSSKSKRYIYRKFNDKFVLCGDEPKENPNKEYRIKTIEDIAKNILRRERIDKVNLKNNPVKKPDSGNEASEQILIQINVDKTLKEVVIDIYEALGMDLPTAIRMFLIRSKMDGGIPFETTLPKEALEALEELRRQASDAPEMSLEEINQENAEERSTRED